MHSFINIPKMCFVTCTLFHKSAYVNLLSHLLLHIALKVFYHIYLVNLSSHKHDFIILPCKFLRHIHGFMNLPCKSSALKHSFINLSCKSFITLLHKCLVNPLSHIYCFINLPVNLLLPIHCLIKLPCESFITYTLLYKVYAM